MDDGEKLLEIEFPPLPAAVLDSEDVSAYEVSKANLRLAIDFGKAFSLNGTSVAVLVVRYFCCGLRQVDDGVIMREFTLRLLESAI